MWGFATRRMVQAVVTVLVATFLLFGALAAVPGDPVRALFGFTAPPPELYEEIRTQFHLDEPFLVQYGQFVTGLVTGDLGRSYPRDPFGQPTSGTPVTAQLAPALPVSLRILGGALVLMVVGGVSAATASVAARRQWVAPAIGAAAAVAVSAPVLVLAFATQAFVARPVGWLPVVGGQQSAAGYVLPVLALGVPAAAWLALVTRAELRSAVRATYAAAARARAIPERRVVGIHALRVAALAVVAFVGGHVGQLLAGLIVVEGVFGLPGIGGTILDAIGRQDRAMLLAVVVLLLVAVVVLNAVADVIAAFLDPRIRSAGGR